MKIAQVERGMRRRKQKKEHSEKNKLINKEKRKVKK